MRQRLPASVGVAIILLAAVVTSLAVADSVGPIPQRTAAPVSRSGPAPVAGVCQSSQQCSPVVPRGAVGATPIAVLVGSVAVVTRIIPGRRRLRRRHRAGRLAPGFATTQLPPPRIGHGAT